VYDPASGYLCVTLTKGVPGQDFPDLDLLAKLLAPRIQKEDASRGPLIEVLSSEELTTTPEDDLVTRTKELSLDLKTLTQEQREILQG
jgi:protein SHQ1